MEEFSFLNTPEKIENFLRSDIIFVATQECGSSILRTFCCGLNNKWNRNLIQLLQPTHIPMLNKSLNAIHSIIFVKKSFCLFPKSHFMSYRQKPSNLGNWRILSQQRLHFVQNQNWSEHFCVRKLPFSTWTRKSRDQTKELHWFCPTNLRGFGIFRLF